MGFSSFIKKLFNKQRGILDFEKIDKLQYPDHPLSLEEEKYLYENDQYFVQKRHTCKMNCSKRRLIEHIRLTKIIEAIRGFKNEL